MEARFKTPLWIFPLLIAAFVGLFGWWGDDRLRDTIEQELKARLAATLDANVTALEIWTTNQFKLATTLAGEAGLRTLATPLLDGGVRGRDAAPAADRLASYLRPRLELAGYQTAQLVDTNFMVVAGFPRNRPGAGQMISPNHTNKFAELFDTDRPVMITPFKPELLVQRRALRFGPGPDGTNSYRRNSRPPPPAGRGRRGDLTLMQVAAPVRATNNIVSGALALIINPDNEFSKILSVARAGKSGETYAFDQTGLLISRSRYEPQLHQAGLLAATNASSALNLRLRDPGGDITQGFKPEDSEDSPHPLIRLVEDAVDGDDGVDVVPSRDYRGVPVVGAWRWLPGLGFGVATQIDAAEAYRPLHVLQWLFVSLCLLLVLCAVGMFVFSFASAASRRRMNEAELKLKQLGQYKLEEKIGAGGMGVVYRARHALMRRETAVKLLLPGRADAAAVARFEREVVLTCRLAHPNTIQVYDYGHTPDGIFYYAMEYLRGLSLQELVARFGCVPESRAIYVLAQICDSLAEAHALGLVHRDIKPGNIFLCNRGGVPDCVKVLDFGLVREYGAAADGRLTDKDTIEGTPWFMPPEAFAGSAGVGPRSDIYSVGALGYCLLTGGHHVFEGESLGEIHRQQLAGKPVPPGQRTNNPISPELEEIILRCLAVEPAQRPQSVTELRGLLLACPHAGEWDLAERAAWWANYQSAPAVETAGETPTPRATVSIDMAGR